MSSSHHRRRASQDLGRFLCAIALALLTSACATSPRAEAGRPFSLLLFGDHGYHLDYLEAEDREPARTLDQALALEREEWAEDKRPPSEFRASPMERLADTGGYVPASGMMPVARAMLSYCRSRGCDAAVMLGDNIYPDGPTGGLDGRSDSKRFEDILLEPYRDFTTLGPDFRIYATLGNHDWRTSREAALAEVRYLESTRPFHMDGIFYRVRPPAAAGEVEIFVIDTEVLLAGATVYEPELGEDGTELPPRKLEVPKAWIKPQDDRERNMAAWLERSLRESTARWKIVMGHHPLWSSSGSKFEEAKALRGLILPILCRYADVYVAGHEHTLEVHSDSCAKAVPGAVLPPLPLIVSGAASKQRALHTPFMAHQAAKSPELTTFYAKGMIWGYVHLGLSGGEAKATVITVPSDGSSSNRSAHSQIFMRRSGQLQARR